MPFRIDGGFDPGAILAQQQLGPDPQVMEANALKLQQAKQEQTLFPLKKHAAELQLQNEQITQQERQLDLQETSVWQQTMQKYGGDFDRARSELAGKLRPKTLATVDNIYLGHADKLADIGKKKADANKITSELADSEREAFGGIAVDVQKSGYNPVAMDAALSLLQQTHPEYRQHIDALRQQFQQDPDSIQKLVDGMITPKARAAQQELETKKKNTEKDQTEIDLNKAKLPGETAKSEIEVQQANALKGMTDADWKAAIDRTVEDKSSPLYRRTVAEVQFYRTRGDMKSAAEAIKRAGDQLGRTETAVATAKATVPYKIEVAAAGAQARSDAQMDAAGLTEDDFKRAGEQYQRTGIMPAMGRDSVTRGKIVHYGNEWARDNGFSTSDIIVMQAAYAGDKNSLKQFQAQRDQIVSFESTAQKNLDMMIDLGKKLSDTGSKLLNKPLRAINRSLLSTDEQAAFDAAELIARNEVAKVTSGGGLGGVVSDTAKREMEEAMGKDPTISNMIAVAKVLKKDMTNRHQSMDATLSDIKSHIGGVQPGGQQGGQTYAKTATGANGHKIGTNDNGQTWYDIQTGQKVQ